MNNIQQCLQSPCKQTTRRRRDSREKAGCLEEEDIVLLRSQLLALNINTFDLPTLLAAAGTPSDTRPAVICLTCAFLRKTGQLPRL